MRAPLLTVVILLAACREGTAPTPASETPAAEDGASATPTAASSWDLQSSGEGSALALLGSSGETMVRLFCPSRSNQLFVNVPSFKPIGSEERLSFGGGGNAVALVADTRGDAQRGGVTATGEVPANLAVLLSGPLSVSYGAQTSGPHEAPRQHLARDLADACNEGSTRPQPKKPQPGHPCNVQDGAPLPALRFKAIGTEPFWGARIEGRCVTYSHPDDQAGTRLWTRFSGVDQSGSWTGSLGGRPFVLRTRPEPGCSDGMSDRRYPIAVMLTVSGEQRTGCAERL